MARLQSGTTPTPVNERLKRYREELERSGGQRLLVDIGSEAASALEAIRLRDGTTKKDAVTAALISFAQSGR